jgi:hypothetical protein
MSRRPLVHSLSLILIVSSTAGCRLAGTSLGLNSDSRTPFLGLTFVPKQAAEPTVAASEPPLVPLPPQTEDEPEVAANTGHVLTRWLKPGGKSAKAARPKRITIPRTDLDDADSESEDDEEEPSDELENARTARR